MPSTVRLWKSKNILMTLFERNLRRWLILTVVALGIWGSVVLEGVNTEIASAGEDKNWASKSDARPMWITLLALSPVHSPKELYLHHRAKSLSPCGAKITSCQLEIRSTKNNLRMAKINCGNFFYEYIHKNKLLKWSDWRDNLNETQIRRIEPLDDGEYLLAIYVNGARCSNVAKVRVDSNFNPAIEPILRLVPFEVGPGQKLGYLGIQAIGPSPQDPTLTNMALSFPDFLVDGILRKVRARGWSGPVYSLRPGQQHEEILDLNYYEPAIDLRREHTVKAIVGKYESPSVVIGLNEPLGQAWDQATATVKSRVPPPAALEGKVIGPDGNPAADYQIRLLAIDKKNRGKWLWLTEYSSKEGKYDFPNVPPSEYELYCNARGATEPQLTIEQVQIRADKMVVEELSFERRYSFSGKVSDEDGNPMTGITIAARWEVMGGKTVFRDVSVTDDHGRYTLAAPFEVATWVGIVGPVRPDLVLPRKLRPNVKAGSSDVDFVLKRKISREDLAADAFNKLSAEIDKAIRNVNNDPSLVLSLFIKLQNECADLPDVVTNFVQKYISSENPMVRFCAEWTTAEMLYRKKKNPSALTHFDRAIQAQEGAYAIISKHPVHHGTVDDIYRYKISACLALGEQETARQTALLGAKYFMGVNRFNHAIDWLWFYCVTEILDQKDTEQGLAICDAYLKAYERDRGMHQAHHHAAIIKARERFVAVSAGTQTLP